MRKRDKQIVLRFTEEELADLNEKVERAGMNRERYLRKLIEGTKIYERVPHDLWQLTLDLRRIGTDLNLLAQMATYNRFPDADKVKNTCDSLWKLVHVMMQEFIDPET